MPVEVDPIRRRALLARLPQFDPDPQLWARIDRAHRVRVRDRRHAAGWLSAGLAAALVAVLVLPRSGERRVDELAAWQQRSQELEREWHARATAGGFGRMHARLLGIDGRLQSAYDRGAADAELAVLWKQRTEALGEQISRDEPPMRMVTRL